MLELRGVHKRYGRAVALAGVTLTVAQPEVVALLGDNGAGKSTLAKMIAGAERPDAGVIAIDGRPVRFDSPGDAAASGVEMIYQDLALVETLDIASNMFLGHELRRRGLLGRLGMLDKPRMRVETTRHLAEVASRPGPVSRPLEVLTRGQRQALAVARCALRARTGARIVIMDEPTASLGVAQTRRVAELVRRLHGEGVLVLLISHNLPLCLQVATRIVVLRQGALVADQPTHETTLEEVVAHITGTDVAQSERATPMQVD
jgi:ABC-type sugar transport system ATPase subunit